MICWRNILACLWSMLPYRMSPLTSSKLSRSFDRTLRSEVQPEPGRPRIRSYESFISHQGVSELADAVCLPSLPVSPDQRHLLKLPRDHNYYPVSSKVCLFFVFVSFRTLFGLFVRLNKLPNCRGSTSDHNVLPSAASGAVTRTLRSRNVTVRRFRTFPTPLSTSTGVAVPDDGVSIAIAIFLCDSY